MTPLESALYKTRKTLLEVCREFDIEYTLESVGFQKDLELDQCASCSIWLKQEELIPDLDGNEICKDCYKFYGP